MTTEVFEAKRGEGRLRPDGSSYSEEENRQGYAAEEWGCKLLGKEPFGKLEGSDPGYDCVLTVDFKYMSWFAQPRTQGYLIVNPGELKADRFVFIGGSIENGFYVIGWATRNDVRKAQMIDFGYGPKHSIDLKEIREWKTKP